MENGNGRSTEGEANAEFGAALNDEITESAVEGGKSGKETFLDEGIVDLLGEGGEVEGNGLVDLSDGILDEGDQGRGVLVGADFKICVFLVVEDLIGGEERLRSGFFAERFILRVFHDAYDLNRRSCL